MPVGTYGAANAYSGNYRGGGYPGAYPPAASSGSSPLGPPPITAGLVLDLNAGLGITLVGSKVSVWNDQSGAGNHVTQTTDANRLTFTASTINGQPGLTGSATTYMSGAASPLAVGSDRTIFSVIRGAGSSGASGGAMMQFKAGASTQYQYYFWDLTPNKFVWGDGIVADTIAGVTIFNVPHVYTQKGSVGALPVVFVDGVAQTVSGGNNVVSDSGVNEFRVCGNNSVTQGFIGDNCRILVYNTLLSAGDVDTVEQYLGAVYGITIS